MVTDFGIAKVIGGQFNVLATDAYKQVVGQQNFAMGAVVGMMLLVPAVLAFVIDRMVQRRQVALLSARAVPLEPKENRLRDIALTDLLRCVIAGLIVGVLGTAVWASFITYWPYNLSLTLKNYDFGTFDAGGLVAVFQLGEDGGARRDHRHSDRFHRRLSGREDQDLAGRPHASRICSRCCRWRCRAWCSGLGYVFFVNAAWNPLNIFYGTLIVLVVNCDRAFLHGRAYHGADRAQADRSGIRIRLGLAQSAVLAHLRPRHRADLHAGDSRHRGLYLRQCAHDRLGGDLPLRSRHQARRPSPSCIWTRPA